MPQPHWRLVAARGELTQRECRGQPGLIAVMQSERMSTTTSPSLTGPRTRSLLNKVPEVTMWFWVIKILCTTVGESFADWIASGSA
jgi:hypothetical protein